MPCPNRIDSWIYIEHIATVGAQNPIPGYGLDAFRPLMAFQRRSVDHEFE